MKYSEIYNKAADLVEKGWTRGAMARDDRGDDCEIGSDYAESWCLVGALNLACRGLWLDGGLAEGQYREIREGLRIDCSLTAWNDGPGRTQKDVIKLLRDTAEQADQREG